MKKDHVEPAFYQHPRPKWIQVIHDWNTNEVLDEFQPGRHISPTDVANRYPNSRIAMKRA